MCTESQKYTTFIYIGFTFIVTLTTLYGIYKFISSNRIEDDDLKLPKKLYISSLLMLIISPICLLSSIRHIIKICDNYYYHNVLLWTVSTLSHELQTIFIMLVMFIRLQFIFHDSAYALKTYILQIYFVIFFIIIILIIPYTILLYFTYFELSNNYYIYLTLVIISQFLYISTAASLAILFTKKLITVYKGLIESNDAILNGDDALLYAIVKASNLNLISLCSSLITPIVSCLTFIISGSIPDTARIVISYLVLLDIYTNVVCVLLSYKFADDQYYILCKPIHSKSETHCNCYYNIENTEKKETIKLNKQLSIIDEDKQPQKVSIINDKKHVQQNNINIKRDSLQLPQMPTQLTYEHTFTMSDVATKTILNIGYHRNDKDKNIKQKSDDSSNSNIHLHSPIEITLTLSNIHPVIYQPSVGSEISKQPKRVIQNRITPLHSPTLKPLKLKIDISELNEQSKSVVESRILKNIGYHNNNDEKSKDIDLDFVPDLLNPADSSVIEDKLDNNIGKLNGFTLSGIPEEPAVDNSPTQLTQAQSQSPTHDGREYTIHSTQL